ncbi:MAG TPA: hypothetical protein VF528_10995 [Pyrinomonadaceae bacterium]|jgi:hypothetical protein
MKRIPAVVSLSVCLLALCAFSSAGYAQGTQKKEGTVGGTKGNPTCAIDAGNGHVAHVSCDSINASCDLRTGTCSVGARVGTVVYLRDRTAVKNPNAAARTRNVRRSTKAARTHKPKH